MAAEIFQSLHSIITVTVFIFGLILGSFFNVIICRLPANKFFMCSRSICPSCNNLIPWYDNIPIVSFIILRTKCRFCKASISYQYPLVEFISGITAVTLFLCQKWLHIGHWEVVYQAGVSFCLIFLIPASVIDLKHRILPDSITLGGLIFAVVLSLLPKGITPLNALIGLLCGGGILYILAWIGEILFKKEAMGGGDIKLMTFTGALLGPKIILLSLFLGSMAGAIMGIAVLLIKKRHDFPFGPALSIGIFISYLFGDKIIQGYLSLVMLY
ncbi:MAG: prepilin peptidase [bacterium]